VSITHIGQFITTDSLLAKSMNNLGLKLCNNNTYLAKKAIDFLKNTQLKTTMFFNPYSPGVFWTWYNTNDYNTCRTKRNNKMPNKG
jgi:hypothetical protein